MPLLTARRVGLGKQECVVSDTSGAATLRTTSHLFSPVPWMDHQHLQRCSLLIILTPPNYAAQRMKGGGSYPCGSDRGLGGFRGGSGGLGDRDGAHFASPLAVRPQPRWPPNNEPFSAI